MAKRGTFQQEIADLQLQLSATDLTPGQRRQVEKRLANRVAKHTENLTYAARAYDNCLALYRLIDNNQMPSAQCPAYATASSYLESACDKFNPILRYCGVTRTPADYSKAELLKLFRAKINALPAVAKYKTRQRIAP